MGGIISVGFMPAYLLRTMDVDTDPVMAGLFAAASVAVARDIGEAEAEPSFEGLEQAARDMRRPDPAPRVAEDDEDPVMAGLEAAARLEASGGWVVSWDGRSPQQYVSSHGLQIGSFLSW